MNHIYIVLTYTGTVLSRVVKTVKRSEFGHVSISLDENLNEMYSFGRLNPYNAFIGGFVQESPYYGTFKRFKNTEALILEVEVTDNQYNEIRRIISSFERNKTRYGFNIAGLFLAALNIRLTMKDHYYCSEFVKYLLDNSTYTHSLPEFVAPDDFKGLNYKRAVYKGKLNEYNNLIMKVQEIEVDAVM